MGGWRGEEGEGGGGDEGVKGRVQSQDQKNASSARFIPPSHFHSIVISSARRREQKEMERLETRKTKNENDKARKTEKAERQRQPTKYNAKSNYRGILRQGYIQP